MPLQNRSKPAGLFLSQGVHYVMGTFLKVSVRANDTLLAETTRNKIFDEMHRLENLWSVYRLNSEISRINTLAGREPVMVSAETLDVLEAAIVLARRTHGACDPTVGPLLRLWGSERKNGLIPDYAQIAWIRQRVDYRLVRLNRRDNSVYLPRLGMSLDLGWIGKGFALDHVLRHVVVASPAISAIALDFGGQLLFWDRDEAPVRRIHVDVPGLAYDRLPLMELRRNTSVSTTSNAERFTVLHDRRTGAPQRVGHILDPRSGIPADGLESVSVTASNATDADALSTAVFVLGIRDGFSLLAEFPGCEALVVHRDARERLVIETTQSYAEN